MNIIPFRAVRPVRDKVHLVATRSYVSYTPSQLRKKLHDNPYSYLHIIHPDMGKGRLHKFNSKERFQLVRKRFRDFLEEGILVRDAKPSYYIYRQTKNGHGFTGIIAGVAVDDYLEGRIKIHEQTLSKRQEIFSEYLDTTNLNAEPVLLISEPSSILHALYERYTQQRAEYDFTQVTKARHELWCVVEDADVETITSAFASQAALYIADGHHRCASSAALCQMRRKYLVDKTLPWNYFLAYIIDESNVKIYAFNRLVKDLNGMGDEVFMAELRKAFELKQGTNSLAEKEILMYMNRQWFSLKPKDGSGTDAQVLNDKILRPLLGIGDIRKDKRVAFMEEPRGLDALKHAVDRSHFKVAFALQPVSVKDLKTVADRGGTMPPKSTWIEPKLRSGMLVYELEHQ